jgi:hypothetical protein
MREKKCSRSSKVGIRGYTPSNFDILEFADIHSIADGVWFFKYATIVAADIAGY